MQELQEVSVSICSDNKSRNQNHAGMFKFASLLSVVWMRTEIKKPLNPQKMTKMGGNIAEPLDIGIDAILVE